jgi:lambda repressor-like predicted transcriptional regulator
MKRKMQELAEELEISDEIELMETYIQETDQITENGTSENTIRVVPMIPPARREWRTIATSIEIGTPRSIVWPPENWEELSADDRLTAWQFAAMSLECNLGVKSVTNKSDLLDKYAMLALPGTSLDMTSHTNGISQERLMNFNILKGIYMGNMNEAEANVWKDFCK